MPSLIANCLARLVKNGRISEKAATQAQALHDGMQGRLGEEMGPASADAAGALEAARVMAEQARARKVSIAKDAIAFNRVQERMAAHPEGKVAGLLGVLTRDNFDRGGENVDTIAETIKAKLDAMFGPGNEALGTKLAGLRQDRELARKVILENHGVDTRSDAARQIANGWKDAVTYGATRAKAAGKLFKLAEDWRQPQGWASDLVRKVGERKFTADIAAEMKAGGLRVFDKETGAEATAMKLPEILHGMYSDVAIGGGRGGGAAAFAPQMRVIRFADGQAGADAYLRLMGKYGPFGNDLYSMMASHLHSMSREIALAEQLGPSYRANFRVALDEARAAEVQKRTKFVPFLSSATTAEKTLKVLTGEAYAVQSEALAGIMAGVRSWLRAVQLGGATLSAVPGDTSTIMLAARHNGIPAARILGKIAQALVTDSPASRALAARLGVNAYAAADSLATAGRYQGVWLDKRFAGKIANGLIRLSGLQAWTDTAKRTFTMEFLGHVADQVSIPFAKLNPTFRGFLDRYQISPAEWDVLREAPLLEAGGARYFDIMGVPDEKLGEKLMGGIIGERRFAVVEPDARVQAMLTPGAMRGSLMGEAAASGAMYHSFSLSMLNTHMMRMAVQSDLSSKVGYGLALALSTTIAGAAAVIARDAAYGKDPRRMNRASFWTQAVLQGGGAGIFGDFFSAATNRAGGGLGATVAGPVGALGADVFNDFVSPFGAFFDHDLTTKGATKKTAEALGRGLAQFQRRYTEPVPFYMRLAVDRLFADQIEAAIDRNYRKSWARLEDIAKQSGTQFWWRPGTRTPQRPPNLGNATN